MVDDEREAELKKVREQDEIREWARNQIEQYHQVSQKFVEYSGVLQQVLQKVAKHYAPQAIVQTRPKAISSFAEKILRKRNSYRDPVNQFTDLCGGRVITHLQPEVDAVCEFIEKNFEIDWENSVDVRQRLKPTEFGYRSVHYIVMFKPGVFPSDEIDVVIPDSVIGLKAEIQVRSLLEHSWADFSHDRVYKSGFKIPDKWEREMAALAAMLEAADGTFTRIDDGLRAYAATYGAYMTREQILDEMSMLEIVLEHDPANAKLAQRVAKLAITLGDWQKAVDLLSGFADSQYKPVLRDLGVALCKLHGKDPQSKGYRSGQEYLETACEAPGGDADALASLAGTWKGIDDNRARELYRQAYETDPQDPYPLVNYLLYEIAYRRDISMLSLMGQVIGNAIQRCRDHADVGINLPWAFYDIGVFHLLLGEPYRCLTALSKAVQLTTDDWMLDTMVRSLDILESVRDKLPGFEWAKMALLAGRAARFPTDAALSDVKELSTSGHGPIEGPVAIVAGGFDDTGGQLQEFEGLIREALRDFRGTVICGGTNMGAGGLVGGFQQEFGDSIRTVGYAPRLTPAEVTTDGRFGEIRFTVGDGFSPLEPMQYWIDIISSGISPPDVKLLGINGGAISAAEHRLALAMGASVAIVSETGGEASKLLTDGDWNDSENLVVLLDDEMTVRVYVGPGSPRLAPEIRDTMARSIHEAYQKEQTDRVKQMDPSMVKWDELLVHLKHSNYNQADNILEKVRKIGYTIEKVDGREISLIEFTEDEVEAMSEMEHARWNVERLMNGWKLGDEKDVTRKITPYLVSWNELSDEVMEWDRQTVRKIPQFLAAVGLEIQKKSESI